MSTNKDISSMEKAIELLGRIRELSAEILSLKLEHERKQKALDDQYASALDALAERKAEVESKLEQWSEEHQDVFGPNKSVETMHGRFGWRISPPAIRLVKPATWAKVLEALERSRDLSRFVRVKAEVDKEALLAARAELGAETLRRIGLTVEQRETFYVEPIMDVEE